MPSPSGRAVRSWLPSAVVVTTAWLATWGDAPGAEAPTTDSRWVSADGDRVLVVVELLGGNDGLNTVVPFAHDGYTRARRALRLNAGQVLKITKDIGLHPAMGSVARLVEDGCALAVRGVGYPDPDRSHFRSLEIWESARLESTPPDTGWLGRSLDASAPLPGEDGKALHVVSRSLPLALRWK